MASLASVQTGSAVGRYRFVITIFLGSFLLFLVQPMIARMVLPKLGGAPAVWNSAMLVYQALLLAGYAYAHWLGRFAPRRQGMIHLGAFAIAALTLPIGLIAATPSATANPFLWVPALLLASVGPLFFVVSAQAPLIQRWFAQSDAGDPYPLYAASNLGSFTGLISYPLLVEPFMPVSAQRWLWTGGYCALALLVVWCALLLPRSASAEAAMPSTEAAPDRRKIASWILLAAVPSGLILSTTLHITTDLVAMPLLWVLPLGAYLLSFTVAFASNRAPADAIIRLAPLVLLLSCIGIFAGEGLLALVFCAVAIVNLFTVSVALHSRLFDSRPAAQHLTLFYLMMSVGGVLGGIFCALVAPMVFDWTYEHLILLIAAAGLLCGRNPFDYLARLWTAEPRARNFTYAGMIAVLVLALAGKGLFGLPASGALNHLAVVCISLIAVAAIGNRVLFTFAAAGLLFAAGAWDKLALSSEPGRMTRSFFGVYSVRPGSQNSRILVHGTTLHGVQNLGSPEREGMATSYYAPRSGAGLGLTAASQLFGNRMRVGIVGLGAGALSCYARPGESWTYYEIDPVVVGIARDPKNFSFISGCKPDARIVVGDARLSLEAEAPATADVLVVDAFSSDSVPMHLLTREAFDVYRRHLSPGGILLVHISNRYLDLRPVIAGAAAEGGWTARLRIFNPSQAEHAQNATRSAWVVLSQSPANVERVAGSGSSDWEPLVGRPGFTAWSDDHASVLPLIRWGALTR